MTVQESITRLWEAFSNALEKSRITKGIRALDTLLIGLGTKLDSHLQRVGHRRKYMTELVLRIPLFFIIHQWSLLSPTSDYRIIELLLFVFRYLGKIYTIGIKLSIFVELPLPKSIKITFYDMHILAYSHTN